MIHKLQGFATTFVPWTDREMDLLAKAWPSGGAKAACKLLPGRTPASIYHCARRMGMYRRRPWTKEDDEQLRNLWDVNMTLRKIAARIGRTATATHYRSRLLGLRQGCPDGFEYLHHAAKRVGYDISQLRRILSAAGVQVLLSRARPTQRRTHRHIVVPESVDAAVVSWLETEPLETAARRVGMAAETLARRLRAAGISKPKSAAKKAHWRVHSQDVAHAITKATAPP